MKLITSVLLIITFSVIKDLKAQNDDSTKSTTIIFKGTSTGNIKKKKKIDLENNIIKLSPTGFLVGQIPLIYERKINNSFSIQIGAGITSQNYVRTAFQSAKVFDQFDDNNNLPWSNVSRYTSDEAENLYKFNNRKATSGTMFTIQPKIYGGDALEGYFLGMSYSNITYKFNHPKANLNSGALNFNGPDQSETEKVTDFMLHFGGQTINNRISIEYSSALGIRRIKGDKYAAANINGILYDGLANYSQTLFNYEIAIRIGYAF